MSSVNILMRPRRARSAPSLGNGAVRADGPTPDAVGASAAQRRIALLEAELAAARAECERQGARLSDIIEGLPAGVMLLDDRGRIVERNEAACRLVGEPEPDEHFDALLKRRRTDPGSLIGHIELTNGRFIDLARRPAGSGETVLLTDVTEAHLMQAVLARQQRLLTLGELAAGLAHQIRTPLAAALLYATRMDMPGQDVQALRRCAAKAAGALRDLDKLIGDMLAFARGTAQIERLNVNALLEQAAQWVRPLLRPGMALTIGTEAPELWVRGNAPSLISALLNLVTNALQSAADSLTLELRARRLSSGGAQILVCDDGPGIPPALRARVFEPFFTTRARGTGIGLAIMKSIVEAHRGSVRLDEAPRRGACFIIELPPETPG